jgi:hypothetical protein
MEIRLIKAEKWGMFFADSIRKMFATDNIEKSAQSLRGQKRDRTYNSGPGCYFRTEWYDDQTSRLSVMEEGKVQCFWILGAMVNYIDWYQIRRG